MKTKSPQVRPTPGQGKKNNYKVVTSWLFNPGLQWSKLSQPVDKVNYLSKYTRSCLGSRQAILANWTRLELFVN